MDFSVMQSDEFEAEITSVEKSTIRETIPEKYHKDFIKQGKTEEECLDRSVLNIKASVDGSEFNQMFTVPKAQGYPKSNIKKLIDKNNLPHNTDAWIGLKVKAAIVEKANSSFFKFSF